LYRHNVLKAIEERHCAAQFPRSIQGEAVNSADLDFAGAARHGCPERKALLRAFERCDCEVVEGEEAQLEVREWREEEHWLNIKKKMEIWPRAGRMVW